MKNLKLIGKGKFSNIYEVEEDDGFKFALKKIEPGDLSLSEIDILSRLKSPYLIRSLGDSITNSNLGKGIAMELKENNLNNLKADDLTGGKIKRLFMGLILGLRCMHKNSFLHLDIKPRNCLYDKKDGVYTSYLSDFGISIKCNDPYTGIVKKTRTGTFKYFPYELLKKEEYYTYNDKTDVWSLGLTFLCFLGFEYQLNIKDLDSKELKLEKIKEFWDNTNIESSINKCVDKPYFSETDKIDLYELLINMLKKNNSARISSKDFEKLRFFNNNSIEDSCYISNPKEILYIPYSSTNVPRGIEQLRSYFKKTGGEFGIEVYFLSIEIFIRIMSLSPLEISDKTLEKNIQMAFLASVKYYDLINLTDNDLKVFKENSYDLAELLEGDIAPNYYFYKSEYLEDLILVDNIVLKNYNLTSFYNYLNIDDLYDFFRQNYEYNNSKKDKSISCKQFFQLSIPGKNTQNMIENDRKVFSFLDIKSNQKIKAEDVAEIDEIQEFERKFRDLFLTKLKKDLAVYSETEKNEIKKIKDCENIVFFYNKFFTEKNINIYDLLMDFDKDIEFGLIEEDIYGKLHFKGNLNSLHILFKIKNNISLLVREPDETVITHYYSTYNENLENYFKENSYGYRNNYELKTPSICKINEICLIFLIFYNNLKKSNSYNVLYLQDKTLKTVLAYCIIMSRKLEKFT